MVVNSRNEASITTTGTIDTNGTVTVFANALSNNTTVADASTIPSDLDQEPADNKVLVAMVTEDHSTTLPGQMTLTKLTGTTGDTAATQDPYSHTYTVDKDGIFSFGSGITTSESGVSNGPQYLTAGRYKLTFKVLASLGFATEGCNH